MNKKPYRINGKDLVNKAENVLYNGDIANVENVEDAIDNLNSRLEDVEENGGGISTDDIVNDLTTGGTDKALSAEQGKTLKTLVDGKQAALNFDSSPQALSNNPVTSKGIKEYVDGKLTTVTLNNIPAGSVNIVDDLTTGGSAKVLSAEQGKVLDGNKQAKMEIYVAASDAPAWQKNGADYVCDGTNDEVEIQAALDDIANTGGRVRLSSGTFWIDSWQHTRHNYAGAYGKCALMFPYNKAVEYVIEGDNLPLTLNGSGGGTKIRVSNALYENTAADDYCCILAPVWSGLQTASNVGLKVLNIRFAIPWNQKPLMCIDAFCVGRVYLQNIDATAWTSNYDPEWEPVGSEVCPVPVQGCVAIRGLGGGNWGSVADFRNIMVSGFYEGFKFAGEHVIGINIAAMYCYYPFTFGNWDYTGISGHPMTFINISEEHCCCGPYFHHADFQQIDFIGYNNEVIPSRTPGGARLKDATIQSGKESEFFGNITYTSMYGSYVNKANARFWEPGQIHHFNTKNMLTEPQHQEPS